MLSYLNSCSFFSSTPIDPKVERKATGEVQFNINKFKTKTFLNTLISKLKNYDLKIEQRGGSSGCKIALRRQQSSTTPHRAAK